jgi:hypothetical protein
MIWAMAALTPAWGATAPAQSPVRIAAKDAFWFGDFAALEAQNTTLKQSGRLSAEGAPELGQFRNGVHDVLRDDGPRRDAYLREVEALTLEWATEHPKSALAHVLHAQALEQHAWSYRGDGFNKSVPPQAWKDFEAYLRRAVEYLQAHADVALTDSYAHWTLLSIGRGLGWDRKQLQAIAQDGLKRNPQDTYLYFGMMTSLLPKWGGDARTLDKFIREVAEQTRAEHGMAMYARLYSAAADEEYSHRLFDDSHADWAKIKQGYEDILARYPNSAVRRNQFAYMACLAKDKVTLLALLDELGPKVDASEWGANPERSVEVCQRLARQL